MSDVTFEPLKTASSDYTCWTLMRGDEILASVLTRSTATEDQAREALVRRLWQNAEVMAWVDSLSAAETFRS